MDRRLATSIPKVDFSVGAKLWLARETARGASFEMTIAPRVHIKFRNLVSVGAEAWCEGRMQRGASFEMTGWRRRFLSAEGRVAPVSVP
jgi:hypothetical protein